MYKNRKEMLEMNMKSVFIKMALPAMAGMVAVAFIQPSRCDLHRAVRIRRGCRGGSHFLQRCSSEYCRCHVVCYGSHITFIKGNWRK